MVCERHDVSVMPKQIYSSLKMQCNYNISNSQHEYGDVTLRSFIHIRHILV